MRKYETTPPRLLGALMMLLAICFLTAIAYGPTTKWFSIPFGVLFVLSWGAGTALILE